MCMFKGCCTNKDVSKLSIKDRYSQITWTSAWGDFGAKSIFDTIDNLEPGMELDYETWQKLMYANKLLAKHYNWFEDLHSYKGIIPKWNAKNEEFDIVLCNDSKMKSTDLKAYFDNVKLEKKNIY